MYYQVRYIDEYGKEVVRIDSDGRMSRIIRPENLQYKVHRYYFQEAIQLPPGGVYVSPLDLNRELGEIEEPYIPVIRYATPVFDAANDLRGIVIINVYTSQFLNMLQRGNGHNGNLIMVDQDGYYLVHPDRDHLWGSPVDLATGLSVMDDYGSTYAAAILSGREGDFTAESRVVVYTTLFPVRVDQDHYWVIMTDESAVSLFEPVSNFRLTAIAILVLALVVAFFIALLLSRQLTAPILALRSGVERFMRDDVPEPVPVQTRDEIGQLTVAFNEMSAVINQHFDQLDKLTAASQKISSGLESEVTLQATVDAANDLFDAEYCAVTLINSQSPEFPEPAADAGDASWRAYRRDPLIVRAGQQAMQQGSWQSAYLEEIDGRYYCAPLCIGLDDQGLIELYGRESELQDASTGSLLLTLAVAVSIALENSKLYESLDDHKQQLQELVEQMIDAQEAERKYVAYELHDGLVQYLVGARLQLSKLTASCASGSQEEQVLTDAMSHLTQAVQEGRRVTEGLRPTLLDNLGLAPALSELAHDMGEVSGWQVTFDNQIGEARLSPTVELTAFRIAQEALTNVRKHGKASRVVVTLAQNNKTLCVSVRDGGVGFEPELACGERSCFGLIGMRERAALVGGSCEIESNIGQGSVVTARLPLEFRDKGDR
jgi:signal transduction histidine kinase